ncbi:hypothetical protein CASFOL_040160 [Castilleja foliolosa]|uniref:Uncharacterized protein n=1 Tax=Castilleja foliolosa TaxID=1961234 RepID=A0ABD3BFN7_9LAMI
MSRWSEVISGCGCIYLGFSHYCGGGDSLVLVVVCGCDEIIGRSRI